MSNVGFVNPAVSRYFELYRIIRDVIRGEDSVKRSRQKYLPNPNSNNQFSIDDIRLYDNYISRAVFYNVAGNTLSSMVGYVFSSDPVSNLSSEFDTILNNATGSGVSLDQVLKEVLSNVIAYSRAGIFVDYTSTEGGATITDIQTGRARPSVYSYEPLEIINWRVDESSNVEKLTLVVLAELFLMEDDGFEIQNAMQFRVLQLIDGVYYQTIYQEEKPTKTNTIDLSRASKKKFIPIGDAIAPTDANGNVFDHIPFYFVGSENNDAKPDNPSFYDIVSINLAHYRNSADYEQGVFICGQPTLVVTGLTESWLEEQLKGKFQLGSNGGIPLPSGASAELIQAQANGAAKEAMDTKERQMVALGAKLVEQRTVQRTATEAGQEDAKELSILQSATNNVNAAFANALLDIIAFGGYSQTDAEYKLNTDFDINTLSSSDLQSIVTMWQKGAISFVEMRGFLRRAKIATSDDNIASADIAREKAEAQALSAIGTTPGEPSIVNSRDK